jgi:purine nucleosidase
MTRELLIFDHDGGVDDFPALLLVLALQHIRLLGVVVTPADTFIEPAINMTRKLIDMSLPPEQAAAIPVIRSRARPVNPFPYEFRKDAYVLNDAPILNQKEWLDFNTPLLTNVTGRDWMSQVLLEAEEQVTMLVTGPLTNIAEILIMYPEVEKKIKKIVWMGGALNVPGNVNPYIEPGQDGSMEWNAYWDPEAVGTVWRSSIPIVLCPLDITNNVPVTVDLVRKLSNRRDNPISDFVASAYSLVIHHPYYAWDVLATSYIGKPEMFTTKEEWTWVIEEGMSQGRTILSEQEPRRKVTVLDTVDIEAYNSYVYEAWTREVKHSKQTVIV